MSFQCKCQMFNSCITHGLCLFFPLQLVEWSNLELRIVIIIFYQENISNYVLSAVFWGELIDKFITIDTKFFNKYTKALFINHCDVIHSIFISVLG